MSGLGRVVLSQKTGRPVRVSSDGYPEWMPIGVTIAWDLVTAVNADTTLPDGTVVLNGEKYIRFGTIMVPVTTAEVQTVDLSGADDPNGGTWDLTILGKTITGIAWNVSALALQALINALDVQGAANVTVSKSGFVYTITFPATFGNVTQVTADGTNLTTGASTITITVTTTTQGIADGGMWAPFDGSASNGQQTLARGAVGIMDVTIKQAENSVLGANLNNTLTGLIVGGAVYRERLLVGGTNQPTLANVLTYMPRLTLAPME